MTHAHIEGIYRVEHSDPLFNDIEVMGIVSYLRSAVANASADFQQTKLFKEAVGVIEEVDRRIHGSFTGREVSSAEGHNLPNA